MYQALTWDEWEQCKEECSTFKKSLHQRLYPHAMVGDLEVLGTEDMLKYEPYEDESQNVETFSILDEEPEVTPEWRDQYLNTEILLQEGTGWPAAEWYIKKWCQL